MMALGTVIGGSFFLGSAVGIRAAGPSILVAYVLGGALVYVILYALSEMTVADPAPGSFRTFAAKAFGAGVGFVVGWVYWTGLILAMSSEAIAVSVLLRTWIPGLSLPLAAEPLLPLRVGGIAGSMLTVMFAYAGFEVIGLAASEARDPHRTVPS